MFESMGIVCRYLRLSFKSWFLKFTVYYYIIIYVKIQDTNKTPDHDVINTAIAGNSVPFAGVGAINITVIISWKVL